MVIIPWLYFYYKSKRIPFQYPPNHVSNMFRSRFHYLTFKSVIFLGNRFTDLIARNGIHYLDTETTERRAHTKCRFDVHNEIGRGAFGPVFVL